MRGVSCIPPDVNESDELFSFNPREGCELHRQTLTISADALCGSLCRSPLLRESICFNSPKTACTLPQNPKYPVRSGDFCPFFRPEKPTFAPYETIIPPFSRFCKCLRRFSRKAAGLCVSRIASRLCHRVTLTHPMPSAVFIPTPAYSAKPSICPISSALRSPCGTGMSSTLPVKPGTLLSFSPNRQVRRS